jgi:hypothetical protein
MRFRRARLGRHQRDFPLWTPVAEAAAETDDFSLAAMFVLAGLTSVNVLHDEAGVVMLLDDPMRRL